MYIFFSFWKLTYVAVDRICTGHERTVDYGRVDEVFQPERVVPMLPKVECKPEIHSNKSWNIKRATCVSLIHTFLKLCLRIDTDTACKYNVEFWHLISGISGSCLQHAEMHWVAAMNQCVVGLITVWVCSLGDLWAYIKYYASMESTGHSRKRFWPLQQLNR